MPRKLVCFLVADAVGYSARVEAHEANAIAALSNTLAIVNASVDRNLGSTFATAGDSVIATFETSVDAVKCALEIQKSVSRSKQDALALRIGIHFGDVSVDGETLLGDGLNIAARLEPLAPAGGILITNVVADQIVGKVDDVFAPVGKQKVKNISRSLDLYCWPVDAARRHRRRQLVRKWPYVLAGLATCASILGWAMFSVPQETPPPLRDIIAVLPFQQPENAPGDRTIADGLALDLTIRLAELSGISVVPSSLSFSVTEHGLDAIRAARSFGARYVVDGNIFIRENELRIGIELIDGTNSTIVWAGAYNGSSLRLVEIRDQIIQDIAAEISGQITDKDLDRLRKTGTNNPDAYKTILLGRQAASAFSPDSSYLAESYFLKAIDLDENYARAYAELAAIYAIRFENGWTVLSAADKEKSFFFVEKALSLDSELWLAHYAAGRLYSVFAEGDFTKAERHLERAMSLQPANDDARVYYAAVKTFQGKSEEAVAIIEPIIAAHPNPPFWYYMTLGYAYFHVGKHEEAEKAFDRCLSQMSLSPYCLRFQIANYGAMGRQEDALWLLEEYALLGFDTSLSSIMDLFLIEDPSYIKRMERALRAAGLSD